MDKDQELSLSQSLFEAVSKGRIAEVRERLGRGDCDINSFHMMSRTALHIAATKCNVDAVRLLLEFNADVKKVDINENTPLHQAAMINTKGSAEIAELLIGAGVELNRLNKFGHSALDESVLSDNIGALEVLVKAGANIEASLRLARSNGKENIVEFLGQKTPMEGGVEDLEEKKAALIRELEGIQARERNDVEAKKKEKKKLIEKAKTSMKTETERMEREIAVLELKRAELAAELARYKKEEEKKIKTLTLELNDLSHDLDFKLAGSVRAEDVVKCLECPLCLDLCKPPKEIWQCSEGHIMCEDCAYRPELVHCSQCRTPLYAQDGEERLTRNRALEELARRTFPPGRGESTLGRGLRNRGGRGRLRGRASRAPAIRSVSPVRLTARRSDPVDQSINFRQLDQLDLDDEEDDWDLDREFPYEDSGHDRDVWVDLEEWRREEDDEADEEEVEEFAGSPTRRASYTTAQHYNARLRSPVQVAGGARHTPPTRPGRGHRRRSVHYYGHHHNSQALYYRGRGQNGWGMRQLR